MTSPHDGALPVRHPWFIGGVLLLVSVVLSVTVAPQGPLLHGGGTVATLCFAASLLVFAYGVRGSGSVTARRPLGTAALTLLAVWALVGVLTDLLGSSASAETLSPAVLVFSYVDPYLRFALALIAVIQIGRAAVVPVPWNWAAAWTLAGLTVPWLVSTIVVAATREGSAITPLLLLSSVDTLVRVAGAVFLGILAIVLADRSTRPPEAARRDVGAATSARKAEPSN